MVKRYKDGLDNNEVAKQRRKYGTSMVINVTHSLGMLPTRNFQEGSFPEGIDEIGGDAYASDVIRHRGCLGCILACAKVTCTKGGKFAGDIQEGPEYESIAMLGSNLGVSDRGAVYRANLLCDMLGLDTISAGNVIGFLMECFEKGFISQETCEGLDLRFGDYQSVFELLQLIAHRRGIGNLLADGVRQTAEKIGKKSINFAMQIKGLEFPGYDPRAGFGIALAYAVSPRGACHRRAWPPKIESFGNIRPDTVKGKPSIVKKMYDENCIFHSMLACDFPCRVAPVKIQECADYLNAVTGMNWSEESLYTLADRVETVIRLYNLREGLSREDDILPERVFHDSFEAGPTKGWRVPREGFKLMISEYYKLRGWDENGVPRPETMETLGIVTSSQEDCTCFV
jgi:aldehyde:ferredoxin oxidoreductase